MCAGCRPCDARLMKVGIHFLLVVCLGREGNPLSNVWPRLLSDKPTTLINPVFPLFPRFFLTGEQASTCRTIAYEKVQKLVPIPALLVTGSKEAPLEAKKSWYQGVGMRGNGRKAYQLKGDYYGKITPVRGFSSRLKNDNRLRSSRRPDR